MDRTGKALRFGALLSTLLLMAACSQVRQEHIAQFRAPDCEQPAGEKEFFEYWVGGRGPYPVNWAGCDKHGADLSGRALGTSNFTDTNLAQANLQDADLGAALFRRTDLSGANLQGAILTAAFLKDVNLTDADLSGAKIYGGTYTNVDFSGATWTDGTTVCAKDSIDNCNAN